MYGMKAVPIDFCTNNTLEGFRSLLQEEQYEYNRTNGAKSPAAPLYLASNNGKLSTSRRILGLLGCRASLMEDELPSHTVYPWLDGFVALSSSDDLGTKAPK